MNELNKKLAEWRFPNGRVTVWDNCIQVDFPESEGGSSAEFIELFTKSLSACFKWLVPKLKPEVIRLIPITGVKEQFDYGERWGCILTPEGWGANVSVLTDSSNPALALCKAIEKLL